MKLEDITKDALLEGIVPGSAVTVMMVEPIGPDARKVFFRTSSGDLGERILYREHEATIDLAELGRPWSFDAPGDEYRLAAEAERFRMAWLFDPYVAVSTSLIEPLPHQISAVYETMLHRLPLRFLLADDPGAGKTIMAGLLVKELMVRGDLRRCLIIAPGSLTEQWQDELSDKFQLGFDLLTTDMIRASRAENPFDENDLLIARMDQLSRNEELQEQLLGSPEWDLIIVDEAHRMSASYTGGEVKKTKRYRSGEAIGGHTRNLLLMTATPHNGKEEDFQLFLALLDSDRFEGKFRDGVHVQDPSDLMVRRIKEELIRFDKTPLFPERRSYTASYTLSDNELHLYDQVTTYVREEMNRVERIDLGEGPRRVNVGFALMTLQRRLASCSLAIYTSLKRRRDRLESRLREEKITLQAGKIREQDLFEDLEEVDDLDDFYEEHTQDEVEEAEERLVDNATAATTVAELETEIAELKRLEELAFKVVQTGDDAKWAQLQKILNDDLMRDESGNRRKLVIFSEFKDTLEYLLHKIRNELGSDDAVHVIHGGVTRKDRQKLVHRFMNDPEMLVLIGNDAMGEGINLQRGHLMVNYDLPWNPNRLEQRFGRIHRIGQKEVCHLWNLIATNTREADVYQKLLEKLEAESAALGGKVFDVLGQLFVEKSLRKLLEEAIRYGDQPEVRRRLTEQVDSATDPQHLHDLVNRHQLTYQVVDSESVQQIKEDLELAEARRLQPHFVSAFFVEAFRRLGGQIGKKEEGRWEIIKVPNTVIARDRQAGRGAPISPRYERICFEKDHIGEKPRAELITLGHPLLDATNFLISERYGKALQAGSVLIDQQDASTEPQLLFNVLEKIQDGRPGIRGGAHLISQRMQFLACSKDQPFVNAGHAPYLDLDPASDEELELLQEILDAEWMRRDWKGDVENHVAEHLLPEHLHRVHTERIAFLEKTEHEVEARLKKEISHWERVWLELREKEEAGKKTRLPADRARDRMEKLTDRLQQRQQEIALEKQISAQPPLLTGGAFIVPAGLLRQLSGDKSEQESDPGSGIDAQQKKRVELLAMDKVMETERRLGRLPEDVSAQRGIGCDICSHDPSAAEGTNRPSYYFIEVKGRTVGSDNITLTANEVKTANNCQANEISNFRLAIVEVEGETVHEPIYIERYDYGTLGFEQTSSVYPLASLKRHGAPPA